MIRITQNPPESLWRSLQTLCATRVLISLVLLVFLSLNSNPFFGDTSSDLHRNTCLVYLFLAILFALLQIKIKHYFLGQITGQILTDLLVISILYLAAGGMKSGLVILYLFPLAGSALLAPLVLALFFAALVTLFLLLEGFYLVLQHMQDVSISQTGLYGGAFLATVYVVNRLAGSLIRQEELAFQRGKDLHIQQAINKLVIADMGDGIVVVDHDSRVFACNPAAERMLGLSFTPGGAKLVEIPSLLPIATAFFSWHGAAPDTKPDWIDTGMFADISLADELAAGGMVVVKGVRRDVLTHLKLRFATVNADFDASDDRTVIFLQDVSEMENQAQQLKLASMGRLTASIAHEVRNPLSAISYATGLLGEEGSSSVQGKRLLKIIGDNVLRLNQLIEDILRLSRKSQLHGNPLSLKMTLLEIVQEFQETYNIAPNVIVSDVPDDILIRFDPMHLREVIVNLLTNAVRFASGMQGSIRLFTVSDLLHQLELHVQDDGADIKSEVRAHLFEPFYTTSSRGTGLGLYMARELCLNNGALLDYEYRVTSAEPGVVNAAANGRFVITFARPGAG